LKLKKEGRGKTLIVVGILVFLLLLSGGGK
jgi:hypothetical protein